MHLDHTLFSSTMSNQEFLLTKEDFSDFEIVKRHTLEFLSESTETLSSSSSNSEEFQQICRIRVPKQGDSESGTSTVLKEENEDEEEDGFKTPTSLDHKISVPSQCPPAPRKTKPSLKRKASYYNNHCNCKHPLDVSKEVFELLFPTQQHVSPLSTSLQSSKKVRRHEHK